MYVCMYVSHRLVQSQGVLSKGDSIIFHLQNNMHYAYICLQI